MRARKTRYIAVTIMEKTRSLIAATSVRGCVNSAPMSHIYCYSRRETTRAAYTGCTRHKYLVYPLAVWGEHNSAGSDQWQRLGLGNTSLVSIPLHHPRSAALDLPFIALRHGLVFRCVSALTVFLFISTTTHISIRVIGAAHES